ncbi:hypothetical protein ACWF94_37295 [Streptomyces sp. NPDC055078]
MNRTAAVRRRYGSPDRIRLTPGAEQFGDMFDVDGLGAQGAATPPRTGHSAIIRPVTGA